MKYAFFIFLFLFPSFAYAEIFVTEILNNPTDGNEWIEIHVVDEDFNFSGLEISDNLHTDQITCCRDSNCSFNAKNNTYVLILEQDTSFAITNQSYCVDDNSIGNGLGNSQDRVIISRDSQILDNVTYNLKVSSGNSLSLINGSWYEGIATPGRENHPYESSLQEQITDLGLIFNLPEKLFTDVPYSSIFKIKNLNYPLINDKIFVDFYFNMSILNHNTTLVAGKSTPSLKSYTTTNTGELIFRESGAHIVCGKILNSSITESNTQNNVLCQQVDVIDSKSIPCNVWLSIKTEKQLYDKGEKIAFYNSLSNESHPYTISYWVEDLFGKIIKKQVITRNSNKKSYTPKFTQPEKAFFIKGVLSSIACNNSNKNISSEKLIVVKGERPEKTELIIEGINGKEFSFGHVIKVDLIVNKADTNKKSIKAYVGKGKQRISLTTYVNAKDKFTTYDLTIPIQLKPNCNKNYKDGKYNLVIEGLDEKVKESIKVKGISKTYCTKSIPEEEKKTTTYTSSNKRLYEVLTYTDNITNEAIAVLQVNNKDKVTHNYSIWSYVYKGPVSYSGERKENTVTMTLANHSKNLLILVNNILEAEKGEYKLKIKILRDDRKTPHEITKSVTLTKSITSVVQKEELTQSRQHNKTNQAAVFEDKSTNKSADLITGEVVYESSSFKAKKFSKYLLAIIFVLVTYLVVKWNKLV